MFQKFYLLLQSMMLKLENKILGKLKMLISDYMMKILKRIYRQIRLIMVINLSKGSFINLSKIELKQCPLFNKNNKLLNFFINRLFSKNNVIIHSGDDLTEDTDGGDDGHELDNEIILIFKKIQ